MKDSNAVKKKEDCGLTALNMLKELAFLMSLMFVAMRACGVIEWEWYWLLSPILALAGVSVILLALLAGAAIIEVNEGKEDEQ